MIGAWQSARKTPSFLGLCGTASRASIAAVDCRSGPEQREAVMRLKFALALASFAAMLVFAGGSAASTQSYHATFVEIGGVEGGQSCGSATISQLGHVAHQCVVFDGCGPNCEVREITFDDGSTLVIHESIVRFVQPGNSAGYFEITQTIVGGTGRFANASGGGTGRVNLDANAVITASGTITLP